MVIAPPDWWHSAIWLLVVPLLVRGRRAFPISGDRWDPRVDTVLFFAATFLGAASITLGFATFYMREFPITASDFSDYCTAVSNVRNQKFNGFPAPRSVFAAMFPGILSRYFGVLTALEITACASMAVLCGAIFLQARAIHSRTAGIAAVLIAASIPPLVLVSRTVTFYPEIVACSSLAVATAACTLRFRGWAWWFIAGVASAASLVMDVRGLVWAAPAVGICLATACFRPGPAWMRALRVVLLLAPVAVAHRFAPLAWYRPDSLQMQSFHYVQDGARLMGEPAIQIREPGPTEVYTFGMDPISQLPAAIQYLRYTQASVPEAVKRKNSYAEFPRQVAMWKTPFAVAAVLAALSLWRRPFLLVLGVATLAPALMALRTAMTTLPQPRQVSAGAVALAIIGGIAYAALLRGALPRSGDDGAVATASRWLPGTRASIARAVAGLALLAAATHGYVPSWLSPSTAWRKCSMDEQEPRTSLRDLAARRTPHLLPACSLAMLQDIEDGYPLCPPFLPDCPDDLATLGMPTSP